MAKKEVTENPWVEKTVTMKLRKGHGPWTQAIVTKEDGTQVLLILRPVKSFRELPNKAQDPFA